MVLPLLTCGCTHSSVSEIRQPDTQDSAQTREQVQQAAEKGDAKAQSNLGSMYLEGRGVAQDDAEAVKWLRKAAEQGDAKAQYNLGVAYFEGRGVAKDEAEAVKWWRKGSRAGRREAGNHESAIQSCCDVCRWPRCREG